MNTGNVNLKQNVKQSFSQASFYSIFYFQFSLCLIRSNELYFSMKE